MVVVDGHPMQQAGQAMGMTHWDHP